MKADVTQARCGARTRAGQPCRRAPMSNGRCPLHGGKAPPPGPAHPAYRHGRYSAAAGAIGERYREAIADRGRLADLLESVALLEAVVARRLELVAELDAPRFRKRASELHAEVVASLGAVDHATAADALRALGDLLERGAREEAALTALVDDVKSLHLAAEGFHHVRLKAAAVVNAGDVVAILGKVQRVIADELRAHPALLRTVVERIGSEVIDPLTASKVVDAGHGAGQG